MNRRNWPYLHSEHIYSLDPLTTIIRRVLNRCRRRSKPFQIDDHMMTVAFDASDPTWSSFNPGPNLVMAIYDNTYIPEDEDDWND